MASPQSEPKGIQRRGSFIAKETSSLPDKKYAPFPEEIIGMHSNHGIKPKGFGSGAIAKINQDRGVISFPLCRRKDQMLIGVYDGHGPQGEKVSEYACFELIEMLENCMDEITPGAETDRPCECLARCLLEVDNRLKRKPSVPSNESGTTAIVALMRSDMVYVACVGDSRCVKGVRSGDRWKAVDLSVDQKPDDKKEQDRILAAGGYVSPASPHMGPARVWQGTYGIGPGLAMGRSIGDHSVADYGVIAEPEMTSTPVDAADEILILASDGVWEFIESQEAVNICWKHRNNATKACKALIDESAARWRREEGNYRDDITAVVIFLPILDKLASLEVDGESMEKRDAAKTFTPGGDLQDELPVAEPPDVEEAPGLASGESPDPRSTPRTFMKRRLSNIDPSQLDEPSIGEEDDPNYAGADPSSTSNV